MAGLLLARRGLRVLVLDKAMFPRDKPCAEYLSPELNVVLERLGLRAAIDALRPARLRGFIITPPSGRPFRGDFPPDGPRAYGLAVARTRFDAALVACARDCGVTVREGFRVGQVLWENGMVAGVSGQQRGARAEETIRARAIIGADGLHSVVARRLGLAAPVHSLRRLALVTHVAGVERLGEFGEMHVRPDAYVGLAPLGQGLANVALVVPAGTGPALGTGTRLRVRDQFFRQGLERFNGLRGRLDAAKLTKPLLAVGPMAARARRLVFPGGLLVGDAARFYDPFTGEGIYRALVGAELAVATLGPALDAGDVSMRELATFEHRYRRAFNGKFLVERLVQEIIRRPQLFKHVAQRLAARPALADRLVGVTGDFLPPRVVLTPAYLMRLLL